MDAVRVAADWLQSGWRDVVARVAPINCVGCGLPPFELCAACRGAVAAQPYRCDRPAFDLQAWTGTSFRGVPQRALLALKAHGSLSLARALGQSLSALGAVDPAAALADLLVVPPSRYRAQRERGYNPIELICQQAGLRVSQPFRVRPGVRDQRGLSLEQRRLNMQNAFEWRSGWAERMDGAEVLLLDDVLTTGATLAGMRDCLTAAGARIAGIWVIADADRRR